MRVLFMGQTGLDKKGYLERLKALCQARGVSVDLFNVGDLMYNLGRHAGKPISEGKILDLPLAELRLLRRSAFTHITHQSASLANVFVNSHAVFRWNNQLFPAFVVPETEELRPDLIITLIDDVDAIKLRLDGLKREALLPPSVNYVLRDLMIWREEEILASEVLASVLKIPHYILGTWTDPKVADAAEEAAFNLLFRPWRKKAYISYPISGAVASPQVWERVLTFRKIAWTYLAAFDPMTITERRLRSEMEAKLQEDPSAEALDFEVRGDHLRLNPEELRQVLADIDGQIVARDYRFIDQSDLVVAYFPATSDGSPLIAGGVQSEITHAAASTKEVLLVWESPREPTPFISLKADRMFRSLDELEAYLKECDKPTGQQELQL